MGHNKQLWYEDNTEEQAEHLIKLLEAQGVDTLRTKHKHTSHSKLFQYLLEQKLAELDNLPTPVAKRNKPPLPADIVYSDDEDYK